MSFVLTISPAVIAVLTQVGTVAPAIAPNAGATNSLAWGALSSHIVSIAETRREEKGKPLTTSHKAVLAVGLCFLPAVVIFVASVVTGGLGQLEGQFWKMVTDGMTTYGGAFANYTAQTLSQKSTVGGDTGASGTPNAAGPGGSSVTGPVIPPQAAPSSTPVPVPVPVPVAPHMRLKPEWSWKITGAVALVAIVLGFVV